MDPEKRKKLHELLDYCINNEMAFNFYSGIYSDSVEFHHWNEETRRISNHKTLYIEEDFVNQVDEVISNDKS